VLIKFHLCCRNENKIRSLTDGVRKSDNTYFKDAFALLYIQAVLPRRS